MAAAVPGLHVVTTKFEEIPAATIRLGDEETYAFGSLEVRALYTPCHTKGHVLFVVTPRDAAERARTAPVLFSGDTLFVGGCGRFFEGDGAQSEWVVFFFVCFVFVVGKRGGGSRTWCRCTRSCFSVYTCTRQWWRRCWAAWRSSRPRRLSTAATRCVCHKVPFL